MTIRYNQDSDTLTITLGPEPYEPYELEAGDFVVPVDEDVLAGGNDRTPITLEQE